MITCIGLNPAIDRSLEVPNLRIGAHAKARLLASQPAGKATNVARILGTMQHETRLCGFIGRSEEIFFKESFSGLPVSTELTTIPAPTRINTTLIDPVNKQETHLREEGFTVDEDAFELLSDQLMTCTWPEEILVFAGSLPPGITPQKAGELFQLLHDNGRRVVLDASGPLLHLSATLPLELIKPNREELTEMAGHAVNSREDMQKEITALLEQPVSPMAILASDGGEGAGLFTQEESCWALPPKVKMVNTVGAGDALLAGFLSGMLQNLPPRESLCLALATAASAVEQVRAGEVKLGAIAVYREEITTTPVT